MVERASIGDWEFLAQQDRHIQPQELEQSIAQGRVLVVRDREALAGWLRWNLFWDNTPFLNLLYVLEPYRGRGYGRALLAEWEEEMRRLGRTLVLTSTRSDETAQHLYRRMGYVDSGALLLPGEPLEIVFAKQLACGR